MYIDSAAIITIASVLGALTAIGAVAYKIIKWFQAQEKQTTDIEDLKKQEKEDIKAMEDELCLLTYAVLACLKGLKEQGCNGPVTEAIGKIEKHINQKVKQTKRFTFFLMNLFTKMLLHKSGTEL